MEASKDPGPSQELLENRPELSIQVAPFPLPTSQQGCPAPPAGSDARPPDIDFPPYSTPAPLGSRADIARIRITKAALTKEFMSLSAIDSAAPGESAGSSWEVKIKEKQKSLQTVCVRTPPRTRPGLRIIFQIFTSCLAACHRSISLLQSSNLQKYLLYII